MDYPIDVSNLSAVVASPCTPRTDFQTGEQRTDRATGRGIWDISLLIGNGADSEQVKVKMLTDAKVPQMTPVRVSGLRLTRIRMRDGQEVQYFSADAVAPAGEPGSWGPAPEAVPAMSSSSSSGPAPAGGSPSGAGGKQAAAGKAGA